jgi:hypothetical protein
MRYTVLEEFRTPIHHFYPEDVVDDVDIDGPLSVMDWVDRGKLGPVSAEDDNIETLRTEAADLGIAVDRRWGAARLHKEIEQANALALEVPANPLPETPPGVTEEALEEAAEEPSGRRRR